jgi:hypothetical protein
MVKNVLIGKSEAVAAARRANADALRRITVYFD